ncbi:MAG TPA: PH domain-containing protein [Acidimicrobiales bacterium]|nr:PH domain-containing protein [Acidimicrobiales bacterium]
MGERAERTDPFASPTDGGWQRVSPRLARMRRTVLVSAGTPAGAAVAFAVGTAEASAGYVTAGAVALLLAFGWVAIGRNWRSWGYVERADDLVVTHGALFRKLTVVPYGRMQLVDVKAGPLERLFGLVSVKLHTAAATTDAKVYGLLPSVAAALRDRLTRLGEAHASGL